MMMQRKEMNRRPEVLVNVTQIDGHSVDDWTTDEVVESLVVSLKATSSELRTLG